MTLEIQPMRADEHGRYVCVAHGGCLHSPDITIVSDGVWVRQAEAGMFSSAHRDCYERWAASEAAEKKVCQCGPDCGQEAAVKVTLAPTGNSMLLCAADYEKCQPIIEGWKKRHYVTVEPLASQE